ncbi:MAG TPA: hypothetical protein VK338_03670 [Candidatus Nitrosocosmicus sp.]|nr:hypothetical protein [Candidatus Nitrosocosmicus sp.]
MIEYAERTENTIPTTVLSDPPAYDVLENITNAEPTLKQCAVEGYNRLQQLQWNMENDPGNTDLNQEYDQTLEQFILVAQVGHHQLLEQFVLRGINYHMRRNDLRAAESFAFHIDRLMYPHEFEAMSLEEPAIELQAA